MKYENEYVEFKETFVPEIYKEVVAFTNTEGGTLYIGVDDDGNQVGLKDTEIDDIYTRITNGIRDNILPDVTMFIKYTLTKENVIRIEIGEGSYKPYYLKSKGLKSTGVYVRQGATCAPASQEQIRQMIKNADGDTYENLRSLNQELSFQYASEVFKKHKLSFGKDKYYPLGIINHESNLYTNLGLLLSDQCLHTIKVAVFSDNEKTIFKDKKEFAGSLFKQLEDTYEYLQLCNSNQAVIQGLERIDHWDYPEATLREALLNALIHRDYSYNGSIVINVNDEEIEFISIGGLLSGITQEDILNGISLTRNNKLSEVFHRLNFIESYGTGIRRIFAFYQDYNRQPDISITPNSFKITLPNMNTLKKVTKQNEKEKNIALTIQMKMIMDYLSENNEISMKEVQNLLKIKATRSYVIMKKMVDAGYVKVSGKGEHKVYTAYS